MFSATHFLRLHSRQRSSYNVRAAYLQCRQRKCVSICRSSLICVAYLQVYELAADNRWWTNIGGLLYSYRIGRLKTWLTDLPSLYTTWRTDPNVATLCEYEFHRLWTRCGQNRDYKQCTFLTYLIFFIFIVQ